MNRKTKKGVTYIERTCAACRKARPKNELIRICLEGGELRIDRTGNAPGRGAYVCRSGECVEKAKKKGALNRAFKRNFNEDMLNGIFDGWENI